MRGDIARDLGGSDDVSGGISDRGDGEGDIDERTVLAAAGGLEVVDALAVTHAFDDIGFFVPALAGDDQSDVLADGFFGEVAEDAFGGFVPTGDDAVEGFADDGVVGGIDDGSEQGGAAFGAFAIGDIARDLGGADDAAGGVLDGRDGEREVDESAVFALAEGVEMLEPFAALDAGDDGVLFSEAVSEDDESNVADDSFPGLGP